MVIEKLKVERLNPAPYNPRVDLQKGYAEYEHIENSINSFGLLEPIVWNKRTGNIVSGHQRFKILVGRGATEVDCIVVDFDEDKEKACNLAMNKAVGLWDEEKLNALLDEMKQTDFHMSDYGFDELEKQINDTDLSDTYKEQFQVIIDCSNEENMQSIYEKLTDEGYVCRISTL